MRAIYKYSFLFIFTCLSSVFFSQKSSIDSLILITQKATNDSIKVESYKKVFNAYINKGELDKADSILEVLINIPTKKYNEKKKLISAYNKGYISELRGEYTKALNYYFEALKISEKEKDYQFVSSINNSTGIIYYSQNEFDKALGYYFKAIDVLKKNNITKGLGNNYNNVGNVYFVKKEYTQALIYYTRSYDIRKSTDDEIGVANSLNNIGNVYLQLNENDKALTRFEDALKIQKKYDDKFGVAYSVLNIGLVHQKKKNYILAEKNVLEGLSLSKEIKFPDALRDSYNALSDLYEEKGESEKALKYYKLFILFRDSLNNEQQLKEINKKEMENELFKKEVLLKAENEKQKLEYKEKQKRNKILIYSTLFILLLIIIFSISIYNRFKLSQKQKKVIEEKQKEILDNIRYAKRIQQAMLPTDKFIHAKTKK